MNCSIRWFLPYGRWLAPELSTVEVLAVPLPWLLLAFAVYPFLFVIGWFYVRAAERNERDFADVLDRS